jgi:hypothetical protein
MNEEHLNPEVQYEPRDLSALGIMGFLAGLTLVGILLNFILFGIYRYLDNYTKTHEPALNPLVTNTNRDMRNPRLDEANEFPQPRLETNEVGQLRDRRWFEETTLYSYGWVDQKAGVAHIPIDRAMQLIAQRGLPTSQPSNAPKTRPQVTAPRERNNLAPGAGPAGNR